jgi:homocysteine S-methyltransferase
MTGNHIGGRIRLEYIEHRLASMVCQTHKRKSENNDRCPSGVFGCWSRRAAYLNVSNSSDYAQPIVISDRYQCSFKTFEQAGYTRENAVSTMLRSVDLANTARSKFASESQSHYQRQVKIALSLGPFGATLFPAQEYDGCYPPPYGPRPYSASQPNLNTFEDHENELKQQSIEALAEFHLERLRVFLPAWNKFDFIALETVPLVREIEGIKRAVKAFYTENPGLERKPWWISTVWPDGRYPERGCTADRVLKAVLGPDGAVPDGVGINCTQVESLRGILDNMAEVLPEMDSKPWLVLYPNGGGAYDTEKRIWRPGKGERGEEWAETLYDIVEAISNLFVR